MGHYTFRIGTPTGSIRTLAVDGESPETARQTLEAQGYFVFPEADRRPIRAWLVFARPFRGRVSARAFLVFNQELLALVRAGLPILTALDLLRQRGEHPRLRVLLAEIREAVRGGAALSAALAKHPQVFPPLYTAALQAGEQSGNFVDALSRYVEYQKRFMALRQRLRAALTLPAILALASLFVIVFLLTFVVPTFTRIYGDMEAQLPAPTRLLIAVTTSLQAALPMVAAAFTALGVAAWRWYRTEAGRQAMDRWALALPWVGGLLAGYAFSLFARTLAMMQAGGIPMIPSLETSLTTVRNAHLGGRLRTAIPRVVAGSSLADALDRTGATPPLLLEMVAVGESSGALGDMLGHAADLLDAEMDMRITTLTAAIEPVIMIGMGLVVATIVVIMYLPIFHLSAVIH